jgi:hypothetical protein
VVFIKDNRQRDSRVFCPGVHLRVYPTARLLVSHPTVRLPFLGPCELHVLALAFAEELLNEMTHHPDTTASIRRHYVFCE